MNKDILKSNEIYHIYNKSIAGYKIFNNKSSQRFLTILDYYNNDQVKSLSRFLRDVNSHKEIDLLIPDDSHIVKYLTYNIMPTHYHISLKILKENLAYQYLNNIGNAFTRYFNLKYKRKGPLWQSSFQSVRVKTDEQLLHLSRYIHLNPTTANLVKKPEDWHYSSYKKYIESDYYLKNILNEITINDHIKYKEFCENQIDYQRSLKKNAKLFID